jgi:hypothetical protein
VWRSLVARFVRDEEAVGSNPATPTFRNKSLTSSNTVSSPTSSETCLRIHPQCRDNLRV